MSSSAAPLGHVEPETASLAQPLLRVLSLNIHKGFNQFNRRFVLHELREAIRSTHADIVFLQEVLGEHRRHPDRESAWPNQPQYEFLADSIWPQQAYGRNAVYSDGHHGNAVLSRLPIVRFDNHDVSIAGPERRGLLHCELSVPGAAFTLHAVCVHLGLIESHRRAQIDRLCGLIDLKVPASSPLLVAGDFNDWLGRAHRPLRQRLALHEVFVDTLGAAARSFPAWLPMLRLDRIYWRGFRQADPVLVPRRPWRQLSDHLPLSAEFVL